MNESPLSSRVVAPSTVDIPEFRGTVWRAARLGDVDAITGMMHAADRVDHPRYLTQRDEVLDSLDSSYIDAARDTIVGIDLTNSYVAFGSVALLPGQETLVRSVLFGAVDPAWRGKGIGRQLLRWQEQRALQQLATSDKPLPGWILAFIDDEAIQTNHLFARAGYRTARYYFELRRRFDEPIPEVPVPEGFSIANPVPARHEELRLARNDAFRDHWGSQPTTEEQWDRFARRSVSRPDLSFVVTAPTGEVAGFLLTEVNREDWPGQGYSSAYIDLVGVTRAWRHRGIAPAMLVEALRAIKAEGLDSAVLDVDSDSLTGALTLYEGVGFRQSGRSRSVHKMF
ncbi:GNAT family N-acetyltransferase [Lacisediminihabitans profunda]|uniref:GNAT family N-acetyltransferase n=1 Tax=Lacisediminihabitans profunda TaxID=2594790 RepID=A0A5C8URY9_9MICO|nr:GNAT family N-acetyltransferase [Lacisediminihabitans profunda]TXN30265.1 GNAT family N-acetyltransferase [Lacisediminihabitans profunda]